MFASWTWGGPESLLGILIAREVHITSEEGEALCDLLSIGIIIGRLDLLFNKQNLE